MAIEKRRVGRRDEARMVMTKRLKELATGVTENQLAVQVRQIRESATQIWLAGLGAFSKAEQEGAKMFEALVAEGEKFQKRTDGRVAEMREKATERATETWNRVEKVFDDRVGRALHLFRVPSRKEIDVLSKRVHELTVITKKRLEEEETHGRGRAHSSHRAKAA
jgi:poly(hydroxyalkanoate) granule-associated protein